MIFSRFGTILSCEVIRDKRTGDSLQYAFIEFENQKDCEQAYFKMQGVLIDDHRIHVDFSQSVRLLPGRPFDEGMNIDTCILGVEAVRELAERYGLQAPAKRRVWRCCRPRAETPVPRVRSSCG